MFGSTSLFGQPSSSPFGSQSVFGSNSSNNNPFAPKPFGSTSPFGSNTGSSIFGGTSTGVFGATQPSSPFASTPTFSASPTPAFGSPVPSFGASSTPAFGSSSSPLGSYVFGQKPAFGGFGSTPNQTSPLGSTFQQTQPAFGNNQFGFPTPFGVTSQPAFGSTSSPAFGTTATPAFGSKSIPAFGSGGTFGTTNSPVSAFVASSTPAFGASPSPPFGTSSSPSFNFGPSPSFGQFSSAFDRSPFGTTPSPFGAQSSSFGIQASTPTLSIPAFGQASFSGKCGGSRVKGYTQTAEVDGGTQPAGKLESISAMPVYKDKCHEELRWEDYQLGDKGGSSPAGQPGGGIGFGTTAAQPNPFGAPAAAQPNPFGGSTTSGLSFTNPFSPTTTPDPFPPKPGPFNTSVFGLPSTSSFTSPSFSPSSIANPFGTTSSPTPSIFSAPSSSPSIFAKTIPSPSIFSTPSPSPSIFATVSSSAVGSSPSIFGSGPTMGTLSPFGSGLNPGNTQSAGLFQSTTPALGQTNSTFVQTTSSGLGQNAPQFVQSNIFSTPSTACGFPSSSTTSLFSTSNQPSLSAPFQAAQPAQTSGAFSFSIGLTQAAPGGSGSMMGGFGQGTSGQSQSTMVMQSTPVSNPFGTLPAMPQMSIGRSGSSSSVQYGISSMPVVDKSNPVKVSSLLTSRHLSQRRTSLPARKYRPNNDAPKVPFYYVDEEETSTPRAGVFFNPRENPRALVICQNEKWPLRESVQKPSVLKDTRDPGQKNDLAERGSDKKYTPPDETKQRPNGVKEDHPTEKVEPYINVNDHRAGEAAIVYEHSSDIEALMPKLKHADYYTEPRIQELAAKERTDPGFCQHVKNFVVGRHGYGSIKFSGETDVRQLDLESLVQFNNREVIVYMDESMKPPVGQGLNKPAEVALLNIKCFDKKSGHQYSEGPKVEKYKEMLTSKGREQGAEFASYNPLKGEWRFRVKHF